MVCASISPWLPLTVPDFWCGFCVQCCLEAESQKQGEARVVLPLLFLNALKRRGCAMLRQGWCGSFGLMMKNAGSLCLAAWGHKEDA